MQVSGESAIAIGVLRHFWFVAIVVTEINRWMYRRRAQAVMAAHPELQRGYARLFRGYAFWMNLPWMLIGWGVESRMVPSTLHFFRPQDGNVFVACWWAMIIGLGAVGTYWLLVKNGAETLVRYPGVFRVRIVYAQTIKLVWCVCLAGAVSAMLMLLMFGVTIPEWL